MALLVERELVVKAFDRDLAPAGMPVAGRSSDAVSASFTTYYNGAGAGSVTLPVDHRLVPVLLQPGMRLQYRYLDQGGIHEQMSGPIVATSAGLTPRGATITFTCASDDVILRNLAWPVPGNSLASQTSEYDVRTGVVQSAAYDMVHANLVTRLGLPVAMVPDFFSGPTATIQARFHTLSEVVYPALEAANRGIKVYQWNPGDTVPYFLSGPGQLVNPCLLIEIYTPTDKPWCTWTPMLGITSGTATTAAPTATRVVVAGQGEGTARTFAGYVDTSREAEWGPLLTREVFIDARDTADAATLAQRGAEALSAGSPTGSLTTTTVDGEPWTVGTHYSRGDRVRIAAITGEVISTEVVRAITISQTADDGLKVIPQIGDPSATSNPDEQLARVLRRYGARLSDLESRR